MSGAEEKFAGFRKYFRRLAELAERQADRKPGLADRCPIRLSELHPRHPVIATDLAASRPTAASV
jgi:hypothetical protein